MSRSHPVLLSPLLRRFGWGVCLLGFGLSLVTGSAQAPTPEIAIEQPALTNIADGSSRNLGALNVGSTGDVVFTIKNSGGTNLILSGTPKVVVSGTHASLFTVTSQPTSPVAPSGSTTFTVRFAPTSIGAKTAALSIANDDADENPFIINLSGTGVIADASLSSSSQSSNSLTPVILQVTGITTGGAVTVERIVDADADGVIDAGEFLAEIFTITDGAVTMIGGVRNTNIPGDEDGAVNGQISINLMPALGPELGRLAGAQIIRVSSPTSAFTALNRTLTLTQPAQSQTISGSVTDGVNPVPYAAVVVLDATSDGEFALGAFANASGQFTVNAPVGSYTLFAVKPGYVANFNSGPPIALGAGAALTQNLLLVAATTSISGSVTDAGNSAGLGGVQLFVQTQSGLATILSSNANGTFSAPVTAGQWEIHAAWVSLSHLGYLSLPGEADATADTTSAAATGVNLSMPKATALIYGTVKNNSNAPIAGVLTRAENQGNVNYHANGLSAAPDASYSLGVRAGDWSVDVESWSVPAGYSSVGTSTDVTISAGQAVQSDLVLNTVTAHLRGQVRDDTGAPIPNLALVLQKYPFSHGGNGSSYPMTDANGNFDLGVFSGDWNIALECTESQEKGLVNVADLDFIVINGVDQNGIVLTFPRSTYVITGSVKDNLNIPIAGVELDANFEIGGIRYFPGCISTDASGNYTLKVLHGDWEVSVRADDLEARGFNAVSPQIVTISGSNGVAHFIASPSTLPSLVSSSPANAATGVKLNAAISFTFSEPMDQGYSINWGPTVNANQFSFNWSTDRLTLTCLYDSDLPAGVTVNWVLNPSAQTANFRDQGGNPLPADIMGSFTLGTDLGPEIQVRLSGEIINDGDTQNIGVATVGSSSDRLFQIVNFGDANLILSGTPKVAVSGADAAQFSVITQPLSPLGVDGNTAFHVRFTPTSFGTKSAILRIANNDSGESPFDIPLIGVGLPTLTADNYASRLNLGNAAVVDVIGSNRNATLELGENTFGGITGASVWAQWTAPTTGWVTINTVDSPLDTQIGLYTETVTGMSLMGFNDESRRFTDLDYFGNSDNVSRLVFMAQAGTTYFISVGGQNHGSQETGSFELHIAPESAPPVRVMGVTLTPSSVNVTTAAQTTTMQLSVDSDVALFPGSSLDATLIRPDSGQYGSGQYTYLQDTDRVAGTDTSGIYEQSLEIPRYVPGGAWPVRVWTWSALGDGGYEWSTQGDDLMEDFYLIPAPATAPLVVTNTGAVDNTAPTLVSVTGFPPVVDVGVPFDVDITFTDGQSGFTNAYFGMSNGYFDDRLEYSSFGSIISGDEFSGVFRLTITISSSTTSGTYYPEITLNDAALNWRYYTDRTDSYGERIPPLGTALTFQVIGVEPEIEVEPPTGDSAIDGVTTVDFDVSEVAATAASYDFSGNFTGAFSQYLNEGSGTVVQSGGVLKYHAAASVGESDTLFLHRDFQPTYAQSWSAEAKVKIPLSLDGTLSGSDTWIDNGLTVGFTDTDGRVFHVTVSLSLEPERKYLCFYSVRDTDGSTYEINNGTDIATADESGVVRLRFDAATKMLTAETDTHTLFRLDLTTAGWGMTNSDTFAIATSFSNSGCSIPELTPITIDDFHAAITSPTAEQTFTITNTGVGNLYGLQLTKDGLNDADFTLSDLSTTYLMTGQSTTFSVSFAPRGAGARNATLHLLSNDADENPFDISLTGTGGSMAPTALTLPATGITRTTATLNGLVNSNGANTAVSFDFGPDTNYGQTVSTTSSSVSSGLDTPVHATLTGLAPGSTWHYRVRATNTVDTTLGEDRSFTVPLVLLGEVNASFNPNAGGGPTSGVLATAMQPDGKMIIGGAFTTMGVTTRNYITRLNADSSLDTGFNPNADDSVFSVAVQDDGKILVAGTFNNIGAAARVSCARLNANGTADLTFDPNIVGDVFSLALQTDGKILIAGWFTQVDGVPRSNIARLHSNGDLDLSFNPDPNSNGIVNTVALQSDGKIIMAGQFTTIGGITRNRIARLLPDGTLDPAFDAATGATGPTDYIRAISVQADGKLVIGGNFSAINGSIRNRIARLNDDGTLDMTFNPNITGLSVNSLAMQSDGTMIVVGDFTSVGATTRSRMARLNADGSLDDGFDQSTNAPLFSAMLEADGALIVGGDFTSIGGVTRNRIARLNNESATQALSATGTDRVEWLRGASAPETQQVSFELSVNGGSTWTPLGTGARIGGGWELTSLTLPSSGRIRGRARVTGGINNGSTGLVETTYIYSGLPVPEIAVFDGNSTAPADTRTDNTVFNFGAQLLGSNVSRTFTIQSVGTSTLNGIGVSLGGTGQFNFSPSGASSLTAGASTTFTVTFSPTMEGVQSRTVLIASNDADENPFEIQITGEGQLPPSITTQPVSRLIGLGTASSLSVSATGSALQYQWLRNGRSVPGATAATFSIPSASLGLVGEWSVRVSNGVGTVTSQVVNLGVVDLSTRSLNLAEGDTLNLFVAAGAPGGSYRWMRGGVAIPRGINPETQLTILGIQSDLAGAYTCQVTMPDPQNPGTPFVLQSGAVTVHIGAGASGAFGQLMRAKPVLTPFAPGTWIVGGSVRAVISAMNAPTRFTVSGLPAGVKLNALTGEISGRPTVAIQMPTRYPLAITASNTAGSSAALKTDVIVQPLPGYTVGSFHGLIERQAALNAGHGGRISLTVAATGSITGKLTLGATSSSFTGQLATTQIGQDVTVEIRITRAKPLTALNLAFTIQRLTGELTGQVWEQADTVATFKAWRQAEDAAAHVGRFEVALTPAGAAVGDSTYPQTTSTLRLSISRTGVPSWTGRLADGATITGSSSLGRLRAVPLHHFAATTRSSLQGWLQISPNSVAVSGALDWLRLFTQSKAPNFPLHELKVSGTRTGTLP